MSGGWTKRRFGLAGTAIAALMVGIIVYARSDREHPANAPAVEAIPVIATTVQQHDVPLISAPVRELRQAENLAIERHGLLMIVDGEDNAKFLDGHH